MQDPPDDDSETRGDSSDVVAGPIGSARLVEPTKAEPVSADLDQLRQIEIDDEPPTEPAETPAG